MNWWSIQTLNFIPASNFRNKTKEEEDWNLERDFSPKQDKNFFFLWWCNSINRLNSSGHQFIKSKTKIDDWWKKKIQTRSLKLQWSSTPQIIKARLKLMIDDQFQNLNSASIKFFETRPKLMINDNKSVMINIFFVIKGKKFFFWDGVEKKWGFPKIINHWFWSCFELMIFAMAANH